MGTGKAEHVIVVGAGMAGLVAARLLHDFGLQGHRARGARLALGGRTWTNDSLGAPLDLGGSWIHGVDGNPLALWCDKLGVPLVELQGDRLLIDERAKVKTRDGQRKRAILGRAAFNTAMAWASWKSKAMTLSKGPRSISVKEAVDPLLHASWLPEIDRLVIATFVERQRRRAGRALRCGRGGGVVADRRARAQRPAERRLRLAHRRCRAPARHPAQCGGRTRGVERSRRHRRSCAVARRSRPTGP